MPQVTQCGGVLSSLGVLLISLQLLVLFQLSKHTTVVEQSNVLRVSSDHRIPRPQKIDIHVVNTTGVQKRTRPKDDFASADGYFNGIPIYYNNGELDYSTVACVGDNYQDDAWLYRSCQFRHFCFDVEEKDFVLVQSPQERKWLDQHAHSQSLIGSPVNTNISVSLGGLNRKWQEGNWPKLKWFPRLLDERITGYYKLPDDYVWVPYHSMAGFNAGHLVWDDFLPIYTLLTMFGLIDTENRNLQPLLTRFVLKQHPLWATCDYKDELKEKCNKIMPRFLPLMGIEPSTFSTTENVSLETNTNRKSNYVCARYGAAGMAMLTDHGIKTHGWEPRDYETTHNMGRGAALYRFRNFMMNNLGINTAPLSSEARPFHITFSVLSSQSSVRNLSFKTQIHAVEKAFPTNETRIHAHAMRDLSLHEQVTLASKSAVFVTSSGGGAVTATFLPRGATLIIYYQGDGSRIQNVRTYEPARLDWDLFNHLSYIRVHWLPVKDMDTPQRIETFTQLIRNELDAIARS